MSKENFKVTDKDTGKEYFISRAVAVVGCIVAKNPEDEKIYYLLERRGEGCPDNVGKLAFPCGYLNWGETRKEAVIREVAEELGLEIEDPDCIHEWVTIDDPNRDAKENVVTRYVVLSDYESLSEAIKHITLDSENRGGEPGEVSEVLLLNLDDVLKLTDEDFAFGHRQVIADLEKEFKEEI